MKKIVFFWGMSLALLSLPPTTFGQFIIHEVNSVYTQNFSDFDGSGFIPGGSSGSLDSEIWRITGMSDGDGQFGGNYTTGDFARGSSTGGAGTGGAYSFNVGAGAASVLGIQPGSNDFTPGEITFRFQNHTGATIKSLFIFYEIYVYNDQGRSSSFNFAHSSDDVTYIPVNELDFTTPQAADSEPQCIKTEQSAGISGISIEPGEMYYFQWQSNDIGGTGSRDEFGFTNVSVAVSDTETLPPLIFASAANLDGFEFIDGEGPSEEQIFTVRGRNLEGDITLSPPANFEISTISGAGFLAQHPLVLSETGGEVAETTVYVRLKEGLPIGEYSGESLNISSNNAVSVPIVFHGQVVSPILLLYNFDGETANPAVFPPNSTTSQFQISSGSVNFGHTFAGRWEDAGAQTPYAESSGWASASAEEARYFHVNSIPDVGYGYHLTHFSFKYYATETGPKNITVELNGTELETITGIAANQVLVFDMELSGFENVNELNVKIKGWSGGSGAFRVDDVRVRGNILENLLVAKLTNNPGYRMLSVPASATFASFLSPIWTQTAGGSGGNNNSGEPTIFTWNFSAADASQQNWIPVSNLHQSITPGEGFLAYIFDKNDVEDEHSNTWPKYLTVDGPANSGVIDIDLNPEPGGWSFLGNPFSNSISFGNLAEPGQELTDVIYIWDVNDQTGDGGPDSGGGDVGAGSWKTYSATTNIGDITNGFIAPFQGFFVQNGATVNGARSFSFHSEAGDDGMFYGKQADPSFVRLKMSGQGMTNSAWVAFSSDGAFEAAKGDALKLSPLSVNYSLLAAEKQGILYDMIHLPLNRGKYEVGLSAQATLPGTYTLTASHVHLDQQVSLTIEDNATGARMPLDETLSYQFSLRPAAKTVSNSMQLVKNGLSVKKADQVPRFSIIASPGESYNAEVLPDVVALHQNYPNPFNPVTQIKYELPLASNVQLFVYDITGRQVATLVNERIEAGSHQAVFNASGFSSGVYMYRLVAGQHVITKKLTLIK